MTTKVDHVRYLQVVDSIHVADRSSPTRTPIRARSREGIPTGIDTSPREFNSLFTYPRNPRRIGKVDEIGRRLAVRRRNPRQETQIKSNLIKTPYRPAPRLICAHRHKPKVHAGTRLKSDSKMNRNNIIIRQQSELPYLAFLIKT